MHKNVKYFLFKLVIFFKVHHLQLLPGAGGPLLECLDLAAGEVLLGAAGDVAPELKVSTQFCFCAQNIQAVWLTKILKMMTFADELSGC